MITEFFCKTNPFFHMKSYRKMHWVVFIGDLIGFFTHCIQGNVLTSRECLKTPSQLEQDAFKIISDGVKQGERGSGGRLGSIRLTAALVDFEI